MVIAENVQAEKFQNLPLELKGITKKFPGIIANDNIEFTLREGEIHTILGENGAGKSTLSLAIIPGNFFVIPFNSSGKFLNFSACTFSAIPMLIFADVKNCSLTLVLIKLC